MAAGSMRMDRVRADPLAGPPTPLGNLCRIGYVASWREIRRLRLLPVPEDTVNSFSSELRQILRRLWRTPAFTVVTLIMLTCGIGANTAVFSVVEGVLLKPLPYPHSESLVG